MSFLFSGLCSIRLAQHVPGGEHAQQPLSRLPVLRNKDYGHPLVLAFDLFKLLPHRNVRGVLGDKFVVLPVFRHLNVGA